MRETSLRPSQLVLPMFAVAGTGVRQPVDALPGVSRLSPDLLVEEARAAYEAGIGGVLLFGVTDQKDAVATSAYAEDGVVQQGNFGDFTVARITQVPEFDIHIVPSADAPKGMGEPGLPPLAPAFANAVAQLTGKPVRQLPMA